jgi:hypothetical protein
MLPISAVPFWTASSISGILARALFQKNWTVTWPLVRLLISLAHHLKASPIKPASGSLVAYTILIAFGGAAVVVGAGAEVVGAGADVVGAGADVVGAGAEVVGAGADVVGAGELHDMTRPRTNTKMTRLDKRTVNLFIIVPSYLK